MAELRLDLSKIDRDLGDLGLQYDDSDDLQDDDDCVDEIDPLMDDLSPDDRLSPLDKLQKYFQSDDVGERDVALRIIPEAVHSIETFADFDHLLDIVFALATDYEPCIRINVLGSVASLLDKNASLEGEGNEYAPENEERLFGVPIRMLLDINQQVRRGSQNCIVNLLEDEKGNKDVLLDQLCPAIKRCLGKDENYDLRMDTALMLSRIAIMLGRDVIVNQFVPLLPSLALDTMFHVRKAFAMSCKELCPVLGEDDSEQHLLPLFFKLCKDEVWGVRKACADVFTDVSASCNLGTRHDKLTPVYLSLLHDDSRWVRKAAFQSLGAFISTFYIPNGTSTPDLDDSGLAPLTDSMLMDNSLLDSSTLASTSEPTTDSSVDSRHPLPNEPLSVCSNTSTPIRPNGKLKMTGNSNPEDRKQDEGNDKPRVSESEFVKIDVPRTSSDESIEKLTKNMQEMTVDDIETRSNTATSLEKLLAEDPKVSESVNANIGSLNSEQSEENDILDSAIEKIDVPGQRRDPTLIDMGKPLERLIQPQYISVGKFDLDKDSSKKGASSDESAVSSRGNEAAEGGRTESSVDVTIEIDCSNTSTSMVTPSAANVHAITGQPNTKPGSQVSDVSAPKNVEGSSEQLGSKDIVDTSSSAGSKPVKQVVRDSTTGQTSSKPLPSQLSKLLSDDGVRTRSSSAGSAFKSYFDEGMNERSGGKKRRWSLDKNNTAAQVRVFVHSTCGEVTEQDLSAVDQEPHPLPDTPPHTRGEDFDLTGGHNATMSASVAMDLTLDGVESVPSDPNLMKEALDQEVVPDELMEIYLSMTEQVKAQVVDTDLPYYCAYSLPGVALTLGREHWALLKPTFDLLTGNMQWKIRRVLAFSLHELAKVVGTENMCADILPVFEEYCTKDIDDVKIGAMSHLAEFFELLPVGLRSKHLPGILHGLLDMENEKNWRYRNVLAEQLILLCDLFDCEFLEKHVYPTALCLAEDKVAEVRATATQVLGVILQKLSQTDVKKCQEILRHLKVYGSNEKWLYRLMYVKQCETFLLEGKISCELFASECLPVLLHLARDKVPNVRIAVARMLKDSVLKIDYFQTENKDTFSAEELQITLECLQHDQDRDVKYFAGGEVTDTRRLVMLPVQWYAQRHRSESFQSQGSSDPDQYQDAQEYFESDDPQFQQPLSLTMAGVIADQPQNHQKPLTPSTIVSLLSEPIREEPDPPEEVQKEYNIEQSGNTSIESNDTIKDSQNISKSLQDTSESSQDTIAMSQDSSQNGQDTNKESQDIIHTSQDTIETINDSNIDPQVSSQDISEPNEQAQDTTKQDQDTTEQAQGATNQDICTTEQAQDTTKLDQNTRDDKIIRSEECSADQSM